MSSHPNSMLSGPSQKGVFPKWLCSVGSMQYEVGSNSFLLVLTAYYVLPTDSRRDAAKGLSRI